MGHEPSSLLSELRNICASKGVTLASIVDTLNDARCNAELVTKEGEVLADHKTRLQAVKLLSQLLQLPNLGKAAAAQEVMSGAHGTDIADFLRSRRALPSTAAEDLKQLPQ